MQKNLSMIFIFVMYSCGENSSTSPQIIDHYSEDLQFLNDLSSSNGKSVEYFSDFIENILYDSSGYRTYRIKKMYFYCQRGIKRNLLSGIAHFTVI